MKIMLNGVKIIKFKNINSTHTYALQIIESKLIEKYNTDNNCNIICAITAENQTKGIGRCNRTWISISGNLFVSIIMKYNLKNDFGQLSFTVACAVRESILYIIRNYNCTNFNENELKLHWPNDIYYKSRKISGILICQCTNYLVISVGINSNFSPQKTKEFNRIACCSIKDIINEKSGKISNEKTIIVLCKKIDEWMLHLNSSGFSCIKAYWLRNISYIGCNIKVKNGNESISGLFSNIDDNGRVVLYSKGKSLFISSGDLFENQERIIIQDEQ